MKYFRYDFSVAFEIRQFKTSCSGLKVDQGSLNEVQLFTECIWRHNIMFCCLHHDFRRRDIRGQEVRSCVKVEAEVWAPVPA